MRKGRSGFPLDAYDIEALKHQYEILNSKERIEFLGEFHRKGEAVPFEIASLAVSDPVAAVRSWSAGHLYLDYREYLGKADGGYRFPDRNLSEVVKADPDPFVRASLYENESFSLPVEEEKCFAKAIALERLAIVRRSDIDRDLIERIFDPDDQTLRIEMEERKQLALAFLCGRADSKSARELGQGFRETESRANQSLGFANTVGYELGNLWTLGLKWPEESGLQTLIFKYVNSSCDIIEGVYSKCERPEWRYAILSNDHHFSVPWHNTVSECRVLKLAIDDSDPVLRRAAYEKLNLSGPSIYEGSEGEKRAAKEANAAVRKAIRSRDGASIRGLLRNASLPTKWKTEIAKRFRGLYQREEDRLAAVAWQKSRYPELPDERPLGWTRRPKDQLPLGAFSSQIDANERHPPAGWSRRFGVQCGGFPDYPKPCALILSVCFCDHCWRLCDVCCRIEEDLCTTLVDLGGMGRAMGAV